MEQASCKGCRGSDLIRIPTYRREWFLCRDCGAGTPKDRASLALSFLPYQDLKRGGVASAEGMYDYFVEDVHIEYSRQEGREFIERYLVPNAIAVDGQRVLDLSGGNGHFVNELSHLGAKVTLTEFNLNARDRAPSCVNAVSHTLDT